MEFHFGMAISLRKCHSILVVIITLLYSLPLSKIYVIYLSFLCMGIKTMLLFLPFMSPFLSIYLYVPLSIPFLSKSLPTLLFGTHTLSSLRLLSHIISNTSIFHYTIVSFFLHTLGISLHKEVILVISQNDISFFLIAILDPNFQGWLIY